MARRGSSPLPWILGGLLAVAAGVLGGLALADSQGGDEPDGTVVLERQATDVAPRAELDEVEPAPDRPRPRPRPDTAPTVVRTGSVTGTIVNADRRPVAGATVSAFEGTLLSGFVASPELRALGPRAESGPDGTFELLDVPVTSQLVVRAEGLEFQVTDVGSFQVRAKQATDVGQIVVRPGVGLRGVVLSPDAKRLAGAQVAYHLDLPVLPSGEPGRAERVVLTDEDGVFRIQHVPRGPFLIFVQAEGLANQLVRGRTEADLSETSVTVQLLPSTPLQGTVVAKPGAEPIEGARLLARPLGQGGSMAATTADAEGRFTFTDLASGDYEVTASADGHSSKHLRTWRDRFDERLEFKLPRRGSLQGQIVGDDGEPIRRFDLRVRHGKRKSDASAAVGGYRRISHEQGEFTVDDLEPGFYTFEVWAKGYALTLSEPVRVQQGAEVTGLVMELERGAALEGSVVDDRGQPIAGAAVSLHPNREPEVDFLRGTLGRQAWLKDTRTDGRGRFLLEDLTAMAFQVEVDHPEHGMLRVNDVVVASGETTDLGELVIDRAATLRGVAEDLSGVPVAGQTVYLVGYEPRSSRTTVTNSRGEFVFGRVPGGEYALRAYAQDLDFGQTLGLAAKEVGATVNENEYSVVRFDVRPGDDLFRKVAVLR